MDNIRSELHPTPEPNPTVVPVLTKQEISARQMDLNDLEVLDSFDLSKKDQTRGLISAFLFTLIAIFIFFVPITINGQTDVTFGAIYNFMMKITGNFGLWFIPLIIIGTGILSIYGKYIAKSGPIHDYFSGDSIVHPILYLVGGVFTLLYSLHATTSFVGPEMVVGSTTGGTIIPAIVVAVFWIIVVGSLSMPFLLNYGVIDFIGSLMEPLMRPVWKVPGRAAVNAIASFVSSSSVGVLITNKLYRRGVYTEKEAVLVVTGFSAVSIGFAYMVIKTAGLQDHFIAVYFSSLLLTLIVSAFIARLWPFSKKRNVYIDGRVQTAADIRSMKKPRKGLFQTAIDRAAKKGLTAPPLGREILMGLRDGFEVIPKVLSLLAMIGTSALIIAEYTPVFDWLGMIFVPLLQLLRVPDAMAIAPSFPVGLAEMFLPVLLIADKVELIDIGARYVVVAVSIVQTIFFAETVVVMMATKMPLKLWELIVVFFERTFLAIIFASLLMRLLF